VASPDSTGTLDATRLLARSRELLQQPVLVTGATGFVGANVVRTLVDAGARVHVTLQASSSTWRLADVIGRVQTHVAGLTDTEALERTFEAVQPGVVLHLATPRVSHESARARFVEVTVLGAANLLRLSREFGVQRVVVTGSSLEYGPSDTPLTEDASLEPTTVHGVAKAAASLLWQQAARDRGMPVCVLRLFHVYGPWESRHRLLPSAIRAALNGVPLPLTAGGGARDWVFVDDVVDAIVRAVGSEGRGEIINVGSGCEYSNDAVVACVAKALGRPLRIESGAFRPRPGEAPHRRADRDKAARLLGWEPQISLEQGIARTIEWFGSHPSAWSAPDDAPPAVI
jgi:nucleoside-diphosphate-sugar epimerase